jgi:UDP-N-acetylglucosamine:LPS N-acetylglucosamine transferase
MGRIVAALSAGAPRIVFYRLQWLWDIGFWFFARCRPTRSFTQRAMTMLARPGILRLIASVDPDVVVSVYPNVTEVLARLRAAGLIRVPVVAAITDLAAMHYWAAAGADLYLVTHAESIQEVRQVAGDDAIVSVVHGLTSPGFLAPPSRSDARRSLGLPSDGKVVLISGGGWGVGDVEGATREALRIEQISQVVCLCGHNEDLRQRLADQFGTDACVRVEGFTAQMVEWLAASDVLVHSTGGLTVLEAIMLGCPAVSYGWGRGHVRVNNQAYRDLGLADVVSSRDELRAAIVRALERRGTPVEEFGRLPSAASCVLALTSREPR